MKTITQLMISVFLCCLISSMSAKNLYLSATGDDTKDGLTAATAVKTLGRIHQLIGVGDIIHIKGLIDVSLETKGSVEGTNFQQGATTQVNGGFMFKAGAWHNSKMIGTDPEKDGFTSRGDGRLLRIDGGTHTFENLLFTEGADIGNDGGCGLWLRGSINSFINCRFVGNKAVLDEENPTIFKGTNGRGGAIHIMTGTTVSDLLCDTTRPATCPRQRRTLGTPFLRRRKITQPHLFSQRPGRRRRCATRNPPLATRNGKRTGDCVRQRKNAARETLHAGMGKP
jgi:hypothetical protein